MIEEALRALRTVELLVIFEARLRPVLAIDDLASLDFILPMSESALVRVWAEDSATLYPLLAHFSLVLRIQRGREGLEKIRCIQQKLLGQTLLEQLVPLLLDDRPIPRVKP